MKYRTELFLKQFDSAYRTQIIEFAKYLTKLSTESDVLIFMARKAACLADCFLELEMANFHCITTSSRVLEMNLDWLKGKKVAIIDDALITGTTIYGAMQKLSDVGTVQVQVHVLSVDERWWSNELINPTSSYLSLNSQQTSLICSNIVKAISVVPRPYNIDYPLFKGIKIHKEDYDEIFGSSNWLIHNATSSFQSKNNIINLTIVPNEAILLEFAENIGLDFIDQSLFKLRLYGLRYNDLYWCQLLPIVILPPLSLIDLDKLFNRITNGKKNRFLSYFQSSKGYSSHRSKLRLVQYYLGCRISEIWHKELSSKISKKIILKQDFRNIQFLFSPEICSDIEDISLNNKITFSDLEISFIPESIEYSKETDDTFNELVAFHKLAKPFLELYENSELSARELVKKYGAEVFKMSEYKETMNRLNRGYSLTDLKKYLLKIPTYINKDRLISLFLDIYIDRGSVVPITYVNKNIIYRAFRHGEDVEFSENEIRLCMAMLKNFTKEYGENRIPHTVTEKLLVLFIRIGIEKDFLNIATKPIGDYPSMGIRFYLHGAIVSNAHTRSVFKTDYRNTLTTLLETTGYIERASFKEPYTLNSFSEHGVDIKGLRVAKQIGTVMGNLLNKITPKIKFNELVLMSTCPYRVDLLGALAAEVQIFQDFYFYQRDRYFCSFEENTLHNFIKHRKPNSLNYINNDHVTTALNSGTWKFLKYEEGKPWEVINKATDALDNELYKEVWKGFWPFTGEEASKSNANSKVLELSRKLAVDLFHKRFYLNLVEASLTDDFVKFNMSKNHQRINRIQEHIKVNFPNEYSKTSEVFNRFFEKFDKGELDRKALYEFSLTKLNRLYQNGRQLLSETDKLIENYGDIEKTFYYSNACVIDYKKYNISKRQVRKIFEVVFNEIRILAKKKDKTVLLEIPPYSSMIKTGLWLCCEGRNSKKWLLKLVKTLTIALDNKSFVKATFFFDLGDFRILRDVNTNQFTAPLFWEVAKELLRKRFKLSAGHELVYFTVNKLQEDTMNKAISEVMTDFYLSKKGRKVFEINNPYELSFLSSHYRNNTNQTIKNIMDVGIITIVPEELAAVTDFFKSNGSYQSKKGTQTGRTYYYGKMKDADNNDLVVVSTQALDQGNRSIISAYNAISEEFNPDLIVVLGIAGSIHKDVNICDVVIADSIYYYDKRAETSEGTKRRIDAFKSSAWTKELIRNYHHEQQTEAPLFGSSENSPEITFKSFYGPIGTGEAVVKYKEAGVRQWLEKVNDKTLAVETEAGGVAQQFYEDELNYSRRAKGILILRGISDKADTEKKDEWRLAASKNAVSVLLEILKANKL